jgi:hypothetical protein
MKKLFLTLAIISIVGAVQAQSITALVTSNGLAPVPAFKLGKPAAFFVFDGNLITTKTFSLEAAPDLGINLTNGQGWFGDTWLQANKKLDSAGRWTFSTAINWSLIFTHHDDGSTTSTPYPTGRVRLKFVMNPKNTFDIESWYTEAVPLRDGIKGDYISFQYTRTQPIGPAFAASATVNLFHLDYNDGTKGFARSIIAVLSNRASGVYIACQFTNDINATHVKSVHAFTVGITRTIK